MVGAGVADWSKRPFASAARVGLRLDESVSYDTTTSQKPMESVVLASVIPEIIVTGVIATAVGDIWHVILRRTTDFPVSKWGLVGRWVAGFANGRFVNQAIGATPPVETESAIGWGFHYFVGIVYAAVYWAALAAFDQQPAVLNGLVFGLLTIVAPFLVMMPALGMGIAGLRTPKPSVVQFVAVTTHLIFGFGLYLGAVAAAVPASL
jgi:hypothetical protein